MLWCLFCHLTLVNCLLCYLCPTVMSGNSADSFSEDSEVEEEKEEVKEKAEVMVKKKGPGRPPRKRRAPAPAPVSPSIPNVHKRRCIPPKSGNHPYNSEPTHFHLFTLSSAPHREARRAEASLVGGRACSSGDSPKEKPHGAASPCKG